MSRYIDADALIERFRHFPPFLVASKFTKDGIVDLIVSQPTADVAPIADTAKKTLDAVRSRATRNAYSCMISGNIRETYTISSKALDEIEKELLEDEK